MKDQTISQLGRRLLFKLVRGAVDDWVAEGGTLAGPGDLALAVVERIWQAVQGAKVLRDQRPMFVLQLAQRGALGLVQEEVDVVVSLLRMANSKQEWTFKDWESVILQVHQQAVGTALAKLIPLMGGFSELETPDPDDDDGPF